MINLDNIIDSTIEEINKQLPRDKKVDKKSNFEIFGPKSKFDSMALINFVLLIDEKLKKEKIENKNLLNFLMNKTSSVKSYNISDFKLDIKKLVN